MKTRFSSIASLAFLALALAVKLSSPPFLQQFEHQIFDLYQQIRPRPYQRTPVKIIDIDDESLKTFGQWPWPRTQLAKMVEELHKAGAAAVVFDMVFAEPDRSAPREMLKIWGNRESLAPLLATLPDPDTALAKSFEHNNVVVGFVLTHNRHTHLPATKAAVDVAGKDARPFALSFSGAVSSLTDFEHSAAGTGALNSDPESDGVLRHVPTFYSLNGKLYPSLAMEALRVAQGASTYVIRTAEASGEKGNGAGFRAIRVGNITIPTDAEGESWLYYTQSVPARFISARHVLDGSFDRQAVFGSIVLIGTSAAGLKDIRSTPLDPAAAGVEVHAEVIEQALLGISLSRPDWINGAEICLMVAASFLMIVAARILKPFWMTSLMLVLLAGAVGVSWYAFTDHHLLVEPVTPMLAVLLVYFSESFARYMRVEQERSQIRNAFSHYMAPSLVEDLARHPEKLRLGGESRTLSVMFTDVRGFTSISEQMGPVELTTFMNRFLTPMTDVILKHQGTIDKYIGDCIMAFWNAPIEDTHHAQHCADAALAMQQALATLNSERRQDIENLNRAFIPIRMGIGINTGECSVGNMGSDQRFSFSALGDEVNLAARFESLSKYYGIDILIGEATAQALPSYALLEADLLRVWGKRKARRIYALLGNEEVAAGEPFKKLLQLHADMLKAYRGQAWQEAIALAEECMAEATVLQPDGLSKLYGSYIMRCEKHRKSSPGSAWDSVFDPETK